MTNRISIPLDLAQDIAELGRRLVPYMGPSSDPASEEQAVTVSGQGTWTRGMLNQFRAAIEPYRGAVAIFDYAAGHPDETVKYQNALATTVVDYKQVMAELGAVSKAARRVLGQKIWPMSAWQHADGGMRYLMPRGVATWWNEWNQGGES